MKPTDFSYYLTRFLTKYLPGEAGASKNTIASYRDTFILFLRFLSDEKNIPADNLTLNMVTKNIVVEYLDWMEKMRRCSTATRNVAIGSNHSFLNISNTRNPDNLLEWQKVLSIPVKKTKRKP
ncbi:site-specific integrase [Lentibacillus sp. CBA3610]|uniref:site-specific integrase n=1 Tax=Lentibacillus sp. CBA3610 TaxID=2518176 RepID=UPI001C3EF83B|nr:site-specific integrase [Lentibacillus sp. CBA3610]